MKLAPVIMLAVVLLASGCKKKTVTPTPQPSFAAAQYFLPLKVGNWWAYQVVDTGDNRTSVDTVMITADTVINSITYYHVTGGFYEGIPDTYYGDSAGNIIRWPGSYPYPLSNRTGDSLSYLLDGMDTLIEYTGNIDTMINVTAGAFTNIQVITHVYYPNPVTRPGYEYTYFSKGIGVTYATTFFQDRPTNIITSQLIGYHISP